MFWTRWVNTLADCDMRGRMKAVTWRVTSVPWAGAPRAPRLSPQLPAFQLQPCTLETSSRQMPGRIPPASLSHLFSWPSGWWSWSELSIAHVGNCDSSSGRKPTHCRNHGTRNGGTEQDCICVSALTEGSTLLWLRMEHDAKETWTLVVCYRFFLKLRPSDGLWQQSEGFRWVQCYMWEPGTHLAVFFRREVPCSPQTSILTWSHFYETPVRVL